MAVKGTIEIERGWDQVTFNWSIEIFGDGEQNIVCFLVNRRSCRTFKLAMVVAKRQAKRLGIDVSGKAGE